MIPVREAASEGDRQPKQLEEPLGDSVRDHVNRRRVVANERAVERLHGHACRSDDGEIACIQSIEFDRRHHSGRDFAVGVTRPDRHQFVGAWERQRPEQRRVHRAENGRRRTDANRQRRSGGSGEYRCSHQLPDRVAKIL